MKKRTLCLLLALVMLMCTFMTSCTFGDSTETTDGDSDTDENTFTLSMYVVTENKVSAETANLVNTAFNVITKSTFKTNVVLHFLTYDEYYPTIEALMEKNQAYIELGEEAERAFKKAKKEAKAMGVTTDEAWEDSWYEAHPDYKDFRETEELTGDDTTVQETELVTIEGADGYSISQLKYPEEKSNQIDIIWIDSYDRYKEYVDNEWLERLDDELSGSSKKLNEFISPSLLSWVKWSTGGTYAIPNNSAIGEYTYLLLNKKYMDKYNYSSDDGFDKITSETFAAYLNDIKKYESSVVPFSGEMAVTNTMYWTYNAETRSIDADTFSLMGYVYSINATMDPKVSTNTGAQAKNLFETSGYTDQLIAIQTYKDAGYIVSEADSANKECAAKIVKGGAELQAEYGDDYYMTVLEYPHLTEDDLFSSMFAVSAYTKSLKRSMEIITYLNTNSGLRNVLQYGVEGVHYELDANGVVKHLNQDYVMNIRNTGNEFVAYPEEGMDPDVWTWGKKQNLEIKAGLINCFRIDEKYLAAKTGAEGEVILDVAQLERISTISAEYKAKLDTVSSVAELQKLLEEGAAAVAKDIKYQGSTRNEDSLFTIYFNVWMQDTALYIPTDE